MYGGLGMKFWPTEMDWSNRNGCSVKSDEKLWLRKGSCAREREEGIEGRWKRRGKGEKEREKERIEKGREDLINCDKSLVAKKFLTIVVMVELGGEATPIL